MICQHHQLVLPPSKEALLHSPSWSRGTPPSFRDGSPVTLVMGLEQEPEPYHEAMIVAHTRALTDLALLGKRLMTRWSMTSPPDHVAVEARAVGYNLLVFAAELASALDNEPFGPAVVPALRLQALESVTFATLWAASCLYGVVTEHLSNLP